LSGENLSRPNALVGSALGLARGVLIAGLIYTLFINGPFQYLARSAQDRSFSGQYVSYVLPFVYEKGMYIYPWGENDTALVRMLKN
ncbi:MAG: hypothetical protein KKD11_02320, partial [Candidatus Omnitrophica bacterium]|nr:hypothetical protein [Candidatus Omnitrophota bacterium]